MVCSQLLVTEMRNRRYNVAGFIVPYKCLEVSREEKLDRSKMRIKKGRLRLSPNEEAQLLKDETEKRRKLRLQQVREQSKENAAKIRYAVKKEKHKQLMKLATDIKSQLEEEKAERVRHLEQQYDNSLRNIGVGHKLAGEQPDWSEERELIQRAENLRAEARGRSAMDKLKQETALQKQEAHKHVVARKNALIMERARAAEIAAMPPPPPDPVQTLSNARQRPVKVMDMTNFATSHYHLQNEHAVDRAEPLEQVNARDAAEIEHERIEERALELKRLRQDQLEKARMRHNVALEKELLKHDYNNILHDLSDLQRTDRERRLKIVHSIPKQVFEPPNFRMEDREDKQRQLEQEFEDMYMAGTGFMGDISLALDPQPPPMTPTREGSLDVTGTDLGSPLLEPTLPTVPPVLRDMTNMPKPRSPGKKPEKVLRSLMDRIKSQREEWITSHSMMEVGEGSQLQQQQNYMEEQGPTLPREQFQPLLPDDSSMVSGQQFSPPEKLPRVHSPVAAPHIPMDRRTAMAPPEFAEKLRAANERQQTNIQLPTQQLTQTGSVPAEVQQVELAEVLKQQELILEQKRQLELKLQQLTYEQQKISLSSKPPHLSQQPPLLPQQQSRPSAVPTYPTPATQIPSQSQPPSSVQQQFISSMSSSGMSQHPMNSIPPTRTTNSVSMATSHGQIHPGHMQAYQMRSAYQPPSAALTTDQLMAPPVYPGQPQQPQLPQMNGYHGYLTTGPSGEYQMAGPAVGSAVTSAPVAEVPIATTQGQRVTYPEHIPPSSLTTAGHVDQMTKVKEYQQYLLSKHEQSKKVLEETKAEIKKRRENLLERYPKLDLSRLEDLGAKYLENQPNVSVMQEPAQSQTTVTKDEGQGRSVPVTSLLASLAAHPYYAATLSQPGTSKPVPDSAPPRTTITVGAVQLNGVPTHPNIDLDTNLRKNKYDQIRKSLPFDADESLQMHTPVRVYEAYSQKLLDTTSATEQTETDTSTLTERGSPSLKPAAWQPASRLEQQQSPEEATTTEESEVDTTASGSFLSDNEDASTTRQDQLYKQLADIQRQKEEIIMRHQVGQQKLQGKEEELKAKLASLAPEDLSQQLRDTLRQKDPQLQVQQSLQRDFPSHPSNLSTIAEVDTPRISDSGRLSTSSSEGGSVSKISKRSLDYTQQQPPRAARRALPIAEEPHLEDVETQMENDSKTKGDPVATYSGSNIDNVLERAKRFETEVLEKLRKQTNAVLFDNEFDDSLEFNVSRRQVSAEPLSSGSLTPESFSTGPLDESSVSKRERDLRSGNGSFQNSKSWADELSQFKIPSSDQSDLSFKLMKPDSNRSSMEKPQVREDSVFTGDVNRFKVYSEINEPDKNEQSESVTESSFDVKDTDSAEINAVDMLQHLRDLQRELRTGEETRQILAQKLAEHERNASDASKQELSQYSLNSEQVSRPFMSDQSKSDLSQYSITDKSADVSSASLNDKPQGGKMSHDFQTHLGTKSKEKELPVRRSPIGDNLRAESPMLAVNGHQEVTTTEYSFLMENDNKRSTSTPGEDRRKSALEGQTSISSRSELPSAITVGNKTVNSSVGVRFSEVSQSSRPHDDFSSPNVANSKVKWPGDGSDLSSYSLSTHDGVSSERDGFETLSPDRHSDSQGQDFTTYSISGPEDSLNQIKEEFQKLDPEHMGTKIKTYAVSRDGELISENSDSDKSQSTARRIDSLSDNLTSYTISTNNESAQDRQYSNGRKLDSVSELSSYSLPDQSSNDKRHSQLSDYTIKSSVVSDSGESNPKSSSFTNITSDPSLNVTGASNLSQYTLNETGNSVSNSAKTNENGNNYVQQRFASLDNLISESKNLIARHKVIIDKNKQIEEVPNVTLSAKSSEREITPISSVPVKTSAQKSSHPLFTSANQSSAENLSNTETNFSRLSSFETSNQSAGTSSLSGYDASKSHNQTGDQSSNADVNSLDYLIEHTSGITEEQLPDLTTMTLGSELSISEAFNKTEDLSDSQDSLMSFEKHEISESESVMSSSRTFDDDSLQDHSKTDSMQDIMEARKYNFMVQAERRAAAVKERVLANRGGSRDSPREDDGLVFRAVPVNVVREPTLSMAVNVSGAEKRRPPTTLKVKGGNSVNDAKKSFEAKESEIKASLSPSKAPLNRALQPRGSESTQSKDSGTRPSESISHDTKQKDYTVGNRFRSPSSPAGEDRPNMGSLAGEIRQFGGSAGLSPKMSSPSTPKKTPPKVLPKPVRHKPEDSQPAKNPSGLSKTLSSWKRSRAVTTKSHIPEPIPKEAPKNSIKVLPQEPPEPLTEEERLRKAEEEQYERKIRAYNPRLFRLQHKLDAADEEPGTASQKSATEKPRESKKKHRRKKKRVRYKRVVDNFLGFHRKFKKIQAVKPDCSDVIIPLKGDNPKPDEQ